MIEAHLQAQLDTLERLRRRGRLWRRLALCWSGAFAAGLLLRLSHSSLAIPWYLAWTTLLLGASAMAVYIWVADKLQRPDYAGTVAALEAEHPDLHPLLSTAAQQQPAGSGEFNFLQLRVIDQVLSHPRRVLWEQGLTDRLIAGRTLHYVALAAFVTLLFLTQGTTTQSSAFAGRQSTEIIVTPGDTELERGSGLVISARFGGKPPAEATLIVLSSSGKTQRVPLARNLSDPVFGASLMQVTEDSLYRVEYGAKQTRDYRIQVFDYPTLTRADAHLDYPDYTGLTNQIVRDTLRISAVEGTRLAYTLHLNKPVVRARLIGKEEILPLTVDSNALAHLEEIPLAHSGRFSLELTDADGRTNRTPADFSIQVLPNRPPQLKLVFPRGDPRVSPLEEVNLQAEASDDFGLLKYGIGFGVAGQEPEFVELGGKTSPNEKRSFQQLLALEKFKAEADQVFAYFVWAEDYGPDGQARRSFSDMFFAEVRPFEEIYRPDQSGAGDQQQAMGGGGGEGGPSRQLTELQKQIVIATWKLQNNRAQSANRTP